MTSVLRLLVGALALLVALARAAATRARRPRARGMRAPRPVPSWRAPVVRDPQTARMRSARLVLGASAVLVIAFGALVMLQTVRWTHYLGLVVWLAAAVVLHDGVLVPAVTALRAALLRTARTLPRGTVGVVQGGFVVGMVVSLAVLPEIWAQHLGTRNPSVLPGDYLARLAGVWAVIVAAALVAVLVPALRNRGRSPRPPLADALTPAAPRSPRAS